MRGAAYLVVPSICYENAPMTVIEAMAVGKPVIASRIGGIPEMVRDGETGLLVAAGDVDQLREAMASLAGDARLRAAMGSEGRLHAEKEFSLRIHLDRIAHLYGEALACGSY
jgi:glycosyltransferase involved in cell wall biosynthesis